MSNLETVFETTSIGSIIHQMAGLLVHGRGVLSRGDIAELRRMDPHRPKAAFYKLEGLVLENVLPHYGEKLEDMETRWAAVIVGLAHLGELHSPENRLGHSLVAAGYSELRFSRLLHADADRLVDEIPMLARFLEAKNTRADWSQAAWLILTAGTQGEEKARRNIAREYYGALAKENTE